MNKKKILIIDGQGGRLGGEIVGTLLDNFKNIDLIAVGTNTIATSAMIRVGAEKVATGENAVVYNSKRADIIVGPIGIVIANSLLGEVTPKMAVAVGESQAKKILIPINKCDNFVIASESFSFKDLVDKTIEKIKEELGE